MTLIYHCTIFRHHSMFAMSLQLKRLQCWNVNDPIRWILKIHQTNYNELVANSTQVYVGYMLQWFLPLIYEQGSRVLKFYYLTSLKVIALIYETRKWAGNMKRDESSHSSVNDWWISEIIWCHYWYLTFLWFTQSSLIFSHKYLMSIETQFSKWKVLS